MAQIVIKKKSLRVVQIQSTLEKSKYKAVFSNKGEWAVRADDDSARRYSTVLSNLTCNYTYAEDLKVEDIREILAGGFSKNEFERVKLLVDSSSSELAEVIGMPSRTLARRTKFKPDESERILRVARAFHRCVEVMEDLDRARQWFKSPKRALGEKTPLAYCDTEIGANEVLNLLGRIEHGVFS